MLLVITLLINLRTGIMVLSKRVYNNSSKLFIYYYTLYNLLCRAGDSSMKKQSDNESKFPIYSNVEDMVWEVREYLIGTDSSYTSHRLQNTKRIITLPNSKPRSYYPYKKHNLFLRFSEINKDKDGELLAFVNEYGRLESPFGGLWSLEKYINEIDDFSRLVGLSKLIGDRNIYYLKEFFEDCIVETSSDFYWIPDFIKTQLWKNARDRGERHHNKDSYFKIVHRNDTERRIIWASRSKAESRAFTRARLESFLAVNNNQKMDKIDELDILGIAKLFQEYELNYHLYDISIGVKLNKNGILEPIYLTTTLLGLLYYQLYETIIKGAHIETCMGCGRSFRALSNHKQRFCNDTNDSCKNAYFVRNNRNEKKESIERAYEEGIISKSDADNLKKLVYSTLSWANLESLGIKKRTGGENR